MELTRFWKHVLMSPMRAGGLSAEDERLLRAFRPGSRQRWSAPTIRVIPIGSTTCDGRMGMEIAMTTFSIDGHSSTALSAFRFSGTTCPRR